MILYLSGSQWIERFSVFAVHSLVLFSQPSSLNFGPLPPICLHHHHQLLQLADKETDAIDNGTLHPIALFAARDTPVSASSSFRRAAFRPGTTGRTMEPAACWQDQVGRRFNPPRPAVVGPLECPAPCFHSYRVANRLSCPSSCRQRPERRRIAVARHWRADNGIVMKWWSASAVLRSDVGGSRGCSRQRRVRLQSYHGSPRCGVEESEDQGWQWGVHPIICCNPAVMV